MQRDLCIELVIKFLERLGKQNGIEVYPLIQNLYHFWAKVLPCHYFVEGSVPTAIADEWEAGTTLP